MGHRLSSRSKGFHRGAALLSFYLGADKAWRQLRSHPSHLYFPGELVCRTPNNSLFRLKLPTLLNNPFIVRRLHPHLSCACSLGPTSSRTIRAADIRAEAATLYINAICYLSYCMCELTWIQCSLPTSVHIVSAQRFAHYTIVLVHNFIYIRDWSLSYSICDLFRKSIFMTANNHWPSSFVTDFYATQ